MKFLFPGFLFALSAVLIPVIIHFFNFRRYKKVYFSNVRFLKDIQQQTTSFRKLKNYLLLALRILAIVFLVLAFAKPYIPARQDEVAGQQDVASIFIDNSYSMEAVSSEGRLLDEAKRRAKEIVSSYDLNTRFQLLTNDFLGKHQRLLYREEFLEALEEVEISSINRNLAEVINRQEEMLGTEPNSIKTAYIISDFQKNVDNGQKLKPASGTALRLVQLKANPQPNISVDSVWFSSPAHKVGETEQLIISLRNNSDQAVSNASYRMLIDDQQKAIGSMSIPARGTAKDTVSFSGMSAGWKKGEISLKDYPIVFDDKSYFSFYVENQMSILEIDEQGANKYLEALYQSDPFFNLTHTSSGNINYSSLGTYPLIILNNLKTITPGLAQQLSAYVKEGGTLIVFPSVSGDVSGLQTLTASLGTDRPLEIVSQEQKVVSLNAQHKVFKGVFEKVPRNINLPVAKKYIRYSQGSRTSRQEILNFAGRRNFLSEYKIGKGSAYLSAVSLEEESSNLPRHSLFVPVMFQSAFLSVRDSRLSYTIGKDQFLESSPITLSRNQTLVLKKGNFEAIPDLRQTESLTRIFVSDQVKEPGIYDLMKGDILLARYAFNDNRSESDLSYLSEKQLEGIFTDTKVKIFTPGKESVSDAIKAVNKGVQLWKLCLILALIFLALEILLLRFYKPAKTAIQV
ncbi:BatA domain-containing protein [Desertivirga brevis]|uniref:BatA domain-containing protein n=1 Tax=Desertivirga brevis TaxID=2810310 RepID=UPI001A97C0C9|nr:BatA domain-containing protein [Pedobacter sp. SYSU D00873]